MKVAYCIAGLGFGDEGKGACCEYLCRTKNADLIVKYSGGCQAAHNVVNEAGVRFTFSQLGAGSDGRIPTYLWRNFIVDPIAMLNEAEAFKDWIGSSEDPLKNVYVHPDCPIIEKHHVLGNQNDMKNLTHGTCGRGIGVCRQEIRSGKASTWTARLIKSMLDTYRSDDQKLDRVYEWASRVNITDKPPEFTTAVFEGSQGILLDESVGFHPHTTWSKVTFDVAHACYRHLDIERYLNIGCIRTYHTRHGAGPLPTEADLGLVDEGNPENEYQGKIRFGHFDEVLFRYAVHNAGDVVDLVAVSHCDEAPSTFCPTYAVVGKDLWRPSCVEDQELLRRLVQNVRPVLEPITPDFWKPTPELLYRAHGPKFSDRESSACQLRLRPVRSV